MTKYSRFIHPNSVCMSYFEHMKFSLSLSGDFFVGSIKAFVHGIFPNYYITSSSDLVKNIDKKLSNAGCKKLK